MVGIHMDIKDLRPSVYVSYCTIIFLINNYSCTTAIIITNVILQWKLKVLNWKKKSKKNVFCNYFYLLKILYNMIFLNGKIPIMNYLKFIKIKW